MAISQKLRFFIVVLRDRNTCRRCGREIDILDYSVHHRQSRGMGGRKSADTKDNLITLCGSGTSGCHGYVESHREESYANGFLVRRNSVDLPYQVPITDLMGNQFFLTDGGDVIYLKREAS